LLLSYSLLAFLAAHHGRSVITVILQHGHPVRIAMIALIAAAIAAPIFILVTKRKERAHN